MNNNSHKKISILSLLLAICILTFGVLFGGCAKTDGFYDKIVEDFGVMKNIPDYKTSEKIQATKETVSFHGRYYEDKDLSATMISFSNSGFTVRFIGTALEGTFITTRADDVRNKPYIAVAVDGKTDPSDCYALQFSSNGKYANGKSMKNGMFLHENVTIACGLEYGEHVVSVYKRSECATSRLGIKTVSTDGKFLSPLKTDKLKIEVFGDSVSCGYAVESDSYYERFTTRTENAMKTFGYYCAYLLGGEVSTVAAGGYPMYKSVYSEYNRPDCIPDLFSMAEFEYQTSFVHSWDNSFYVPDVTVVALGANDGSFLRKYEEKTKEYNEFLSGFEAACEKFINKIFSAYPKTLVIVSDEIIAIEPALSKILDEVVSKYAADGKNVERVKYKAASLAKDRTLPGEGHPNEEMQRIAGYELARAISEKLGLSFDDEGFFDKYNSNDFSR